MKKSWFILGIATLLLGLMYWAKPQPEAVTSVARSTSKADRTLIQTKKPAESTQQSQPKASSINRLSTERSATQTNSLPPVTLESLTPRLKVLMEQPKRLPGPDWIAQLAAKDQPILMQLYLQTTNLLERNALTLALGLIGDEDVVALFKHALTQEHAGKKLTSGYPTDEEHTLFNTVVAMGFLAEKSDSAYDFIKQGTDPMFWKAEVQWSSNRGSDTAGILAGYSIAAIGQSGRSDARQILEQFKTKDMVNRVDGDNPTARNLSGSVVQGAFYYDLIQQYGVDALRSNFFTENQGRLFRKWEQSENGKNWDAWYQSVRGRR